MALCRRRPTSTRTSFISVSPTIRPGRWRPASNWRWVAYAREHNAILLYDAAYEGYISDPGIPHSIFEIPGARERAIEFRSFSKTGGFTGVRCGFTVMSKAAEGADTDGRELPLHPLWHRRWSTKSNGVSYPVQRGAEALYSDEGRAQVRGLIDHYMGNARILSEAARRAGLSVFGGKNAPYIWVGTPAGLTSWQMFDRMLHDLHVVITPGSGFGSDGEGTSASPLSTVGPTLRKSGGGWRRRLFPDITRSCSSRSSERGKRRRREGEEKGGCLA